jgi:hypothetical protein
MGKTFIRGTYQHCLIRTIKNGALRLGGESQRKPVLNRAGPTTINNPGEQRVEVAGGNRAKAGQVNVHGRAVLQIGDNCVRKQTSTGHYAPSGIDIVCGLIHD